MNKWETWIGEYNNNIYYYTPYIENIHEFYIERYIVILLSNFTRNVVGIHFWNKFHSEPCPSRIVYEQSEISFLSIRIWTQIGSAIRLQLIRLCSTTIDAWWNFLRLRVLTILFYHLYRIFLRYCKNIIHIHKYIYIYTQVDTIMSLVALCNHQRQNEEYKSYQHIIFNNSYICSSILYSVNILFYTPLLQNLKMCLFQYK